MKRSLKKLLVSAFEPVDFLARLINNKKHLPPLRLRWEVGPLRTYESAAAEFRVYLKLFAGLRPESRILDIGCGCGQVALELAEHLDGNGCYVGCDISKGAIRWCAAHLASRDKRFSFHHMDVRNGLYNPDGSKGAEEFKFPKGWDSFDVVLVKSVFTHMMKAEVVNYLSQIPQLLAPDGRCLATFFLINDDYRELAERKQNQIEFVLRGDGVAVADLRMPEAIVAFEETELLGLISKAGLSVVQPIIYGNWTGRKERLSHQDMIVLKRSA